MNFPFDIRLFIHIDNIIHKLITYITFFQDFLSLESGQFLYKSTRILYTYISFLYKMVFKVGFVSFSLCIFTFKYFHFKLYFPIFPLLEFSGSYF